MSGIRHGGDLATAGAAFGIPDGGWLDLSTGINPRPYAIDDIDAAIWQRLPVRADEDALMDAARAYYGVADDAALAAAPGTQAIIQWLPRLRPAGSVAVVSPTYAEHAHRWRDAGHAVTEAATLHDADADVIVVVNPNNPDGCIVEAGVLLDRADKQAAKGGWLVVDEAFADATPAMAVTPGSGRPGLVALRSFGKFFGLAGLRLGFAAGDPTVVSALANALGPWSVGGPALAVGARALADGAWQAETRARLVGDAARLDDLLLDAGFEIVGGTPLFRLASAEDAWARYEALARRGVLTRPFDGNRAWLRFGLPGCDGDWRRLAEALKAL